MTISRDGRWFAFAAGGQLWLRAAGDFEATPIRGTEGLSRVPTFSPDGAYWADDGYIYYGQGEQGLWRVSENGGTPEQILEAQDDERLSGAWPIPGQEWLLFSSGSTGFQNPRVEVLSMRSGERRVVIEGGADGRYVAPSSA